MALHFDLVSVLRAEGLTVVEVPGWRTRSNGRDLTPVGNLVHHTASSPKATNGAMARLLTEGRSDLSGPLCNVHVRRDGTCEVIAAGAANHAGRGGANVLAWIRKPAGGSPPAPGPDDPGGNSLLVGWECDNAGDGEPWPAAQVEAIVRGCAAVARAAGFPAAATIGHREWTRRKIDPRGIDMSALRLRVAHRLGAPVHAVTGTGGPGPSWEESAVASLPTLGIGAGKDKPNPFVKRLQALLLADGVEVKVDGQFGPGTQAAVKKAQQAWKIPADGVAGRQVWTKALGL